jgi:hypothetical protein
VEVCLLDSSMASPDELRRRVASLLASKDLIVPGRWFLPGSFVWLGFTCRAGLVDLRSDKVLSTHCKFVRVCELGAFDVTNGNEMPMELVQNPTSWRGCSHPTRHWR